MTFPNALCSTCWRALYECENNNNARAPLIKACSYTTNSDSTNTMHTRACSNALPCELCLTARQRHKHSHNSCICPTCSQINNLPTSSQIILREQTKKTQFTASNLLEIQAQQNASNKQMIKLASSIRSICGRSAVEPGFRGKLVKNSKKAQ